MIAEGVGKVLDVTEAGVVRAASTGMRIGSWLIPFCYRKECERLAKNNRREVDVREQEEGVVRGIGEMVISARRGRINVGEEEVQAVVAAIGPTLHSVDYADVFDPHQAKVLEQIAPLHPDNT